jgi:tRNA pseudouridine55 synthase
MDGILIIDKPGGMTSHDVVQRVRKLFRTGKVGHLGTLDPMATGVLPLCIGRATRIGRFFATSPKEYSGEIRFGFATSTYDKEGVPASPERPLSHGREEVAAAMLSLTGEYDQTPPAYSAKKVGGEASHRLARRGVAVETPPVRVRVQSFELRSFRPPVIEFHVVCSGGTYVRSLAHDLGLRLGCGAHLHQLRRLRSGEFHIGQAVPLEAASEADVIALERLLAALPALVVEDEAGEDRIRHGNPVEAGGTPPGLARIFNKKGEFLAVAAVESGWAHPRVVLTSTASEEARTRRRNGKRIS